MLVLSRKLNQSIVINGNIIVKIVGVEEGAVRLGVEAPRALRVDRQEIHETIQKGGLLSNGSTRPAGT